MSTPVNMTTAQFMLSGATGMLTGKQIHIMAKQAYVNAKRLIGKPKRPRDQRDLGRGSPLTRLSATEPMEMAYVAINARSCSEMIALLWED